MPQHTYFEFHIGKTKCCVSRIATAKTIAPNDRRHKHVTYEVHYMVEGSCSFLIGDHFVDMKKGEILLIAPNIYHSVKTFSPDFYKLCFFLDFPTEEGNAKYTDNFVGYFQKPDTILVDAQKQETLLLSILQLHDKALSFFDGEELKAYLTLLILWLIKQATKQQTESHHNGNANIDIDRNEIIQFFTTYFYLNNGAEVLSQKMHISRRHLERIIKKKFGKSYREMLHEVRLEIAIDLLRTTDKTIAEISEIIGYSNPAGFISFMKNMTGMTPLQYRKKKAMDSFRV